MSEQLLSPLKTIKVQGRVIRSPSSKIPTESWSRSRRVVADTRDALILREASYPAVHYVPRNDVDMALLERTQHATYCPYKGDCSYFSIPLAEIVQRTPHDL